MHLPNVSPAYQAVNSVIRDRTVFDWHYNQGMHNLKNAFSKSQSYELFKHSVPMPNSYLFNSSKELGKLIQRPYPFVVKFDLDIATGIQTIVICNNNDLKHLFYVLNITENVKGIVQDFVTGQEYTVTVLVGEHNWVEIGTARDYKRRYENNQGLNTFGMGSIAPVKYVHPDTNIAIDQILHTMPTYRGLLSCQFIVSAQQLYFLEYNARLCDPEFQSMLELNSHSINLALTQCQQGKHIDHLRQNDVNAVTISLIHKNWPTAQTERVNLNLHHPTFKIWVSDGMWDDKCYWGSITNSGPKLTEVLAQEIYEWLSTKDVEPYRYRLDIGIS